MASLCANGIAAVALTAEEIRKNPNIWKKVEHGAYRIIYASPEVLLHSGSYFWIHLLRKKCAFNTRLIGVAVDEVHVVWGYREFRTEYANIGDFRAHLRHVPFIGLSATLTPITLDYIHKALNLNWPTVLFRQSIGRCNVAIGVVTMDTSRAQRYTQLDFVVDSSERQRSRIPQTFVFVDEVEEASRVACYLRARLHPQLRAQAPNIVRVMTACLDTTTRSSRMEAFRVGDSRIIVGTEVVSMGINFPSIEVVVQWDVKQHLTLAAVWQRIGRAARDQSRNALAVLFTPERYVLPQDNDHPANSAGRYYGWRDAVNLTEEAKVEQFLRQLYKYAANPIHCSYDTIDPALLFFLNTSGCRWRAGLACFNDRSWVSGQGLADLTNFDSIRSPQCCDNCFISMLDDSKLGAFDDEMFTLHRFDFRQTLRFSYTMEHDTDQYLSLVDKYTNLADLHEKRLPPNVIKQIKNGLKEWRQETYKTAVAHSFPYLLITEYLSDEGIRRIVAEIATIHSRADLAKVLAPILALDTSILASTADSLLSCIQHLRDNHQPQPTPTQVPRKRKYDFDHIPEDQLDPSIDSQRELLELQQGITTTDQAVVERRTAQKAITAHRRAIDYLETKKISLYNEKAKQLGIATKSTKPHAPQPRRAGRNRKDAAEAFVSMVYS